jgi:hypothetical protein
MALTIFGGLFTAKNRSIASIFTQNIPLNETVISPAAVFESELLVTVKSN